MRINSTIHELRQVAHCNARCLACNYDPSKCEGAGCLLMLQAADQLELLSGLASSPSVISNAEKHEFYQKGQIAMRDRSYALLQNAADNTHGLIQATLKVTAGLIKDLEVCDEEPA